MADDSELNSLFSTGEEWQRQKVRHIGAALSSDPVDLSLLRQLASSKGGLLCKELRRKAWPKLLGVNIYNIPLCPYLEHKDKNQVILDVNRCGRRLPEELPEEERTLIVDKLTRIILRLLVSHTQLCYYQGLHDVVLTFLLLPMEEEVTFAVMDILVQYHIRDFLDIDINHTKEVMKYVRPLLSLVDPQLESFITSSECEYYFSLSWVLTWYSHVVEKREDLLVLTDLFLASHPLMPVYVTTVLINSRREEVLAQDCEMSSVHHFLSSCPEDFDTNDLVARSCDLFQRIPPHMIAKTGKLNYNASLMNKTHKIFLSHLKGQRPDHVLSRQPLAPPYKTWWDSIQTLSLTITWFVLPIIVGVVTYYWLDGTLLKIDS